MGKTYRIVLCVDSKKRYLDPEKGICRGCVPVVGTLRGISPCRTLYLSVKFMEIGYLHHPLQVDIPILHYLVLVSIACQSTENHD